MILSTKGRYAVMAMVDLAMCEASKPVALSQIAERQEIPQAYLEQIFARLRKADLVQSVRGPGGGYRIAKPAEEISIDAIVRASEESIKMTRCQSSDGGCMSKSAKCLTHDLWDGLGKQIEGYLSSVSLAQVCASEVKQAAA